MALETTVKSPEEVEKYFKKWDNTENAVFGTSVQFSEPCIVGIDEAGRGPVLGPMVYGVCYYPAEKEEVFKDLGCADSKMLTEEKREKIFEQMCTDGIGWIVEVISPNLICNSMLRRDKYSLNQVAQDATVNILTKVGELGVNITGVFIDTVGPPEKYQEKLSAIFPHLKITVAKKADSLYPVVSAASICAKVVRDTALKLWTFPEESDISVENTGSGYPNDPVTKSFLTDNMDPVFGFPQLVRFSWSTADVILEKSAVQVDWEPVEEGGVVKNTLLTSFFHKSNSQGHQKRHAFFKNRNLTSTASI